MKKRLFAGLVTGLFAFSVCIASNAIAAPVNLTSGYWDVIGADTDTWNNSTLYFENQILDGENYLLTGYFWWENNARTKYGKEVFEGTLFPDLTFSLDGHLVGHTVGIVSSYYTGLINEDGSQITNGTWGGPGGAIGQWSASHVVPIPGAVRLLGSGLIGLGTINRKKKK